MPTDESEYHRTQRRQRPSTARRRGWSEAGPDPAIDSDAVRPNPKHGEPFKVIPFDPKEIRADAYVKNFEQAIRSYYKSDHVTNYLQRQHFFEALSGQQRLAIGCSQVGGTYEEMKEAFISVYEVGLFDTFRELFSLRMREGETTAAFANGFKGLLPPDHDVNLAVLKYIFIMKLPTEVRTQKVKDWFDEKKELTKT